MSMNAPRAAAMCRQRDAASRRKSQLADVAGERNGLSFFRCDLTRAHQPLPGSLFDLFLIEAVGHVGYCGRTIRRSRALKPLKGSIGKDVEDAAAHVPVGALERGEPGRTVRAPDQGITGLLFFEFRHFTEGPIFDSRLLIRHSAGER